MAARFQAWGSRERAKQTPFRTQPQKSRSIVFSAFYLSRQSQRPTQVYREKTKTPPLEGALGEFWKWMCNWKYCHGHSWKMQTASNHKKGLISWSDILEKEVLFGSHKTWFWKLPLCPLLTVWLNLSVLIYKMGDTDADPTCLCWGLCKANMLYVHVSTECLVKTGRSINLWWVSLLNRNLHIIAIIWVYCGLIYITGCFSWILNWVAPFCRPVKVREETD